MEAPFLAAPLEGVVVAAGVEGDEEAVPDDLEGAVEPELEAEVLAFPEALEADVVDWEEAETVWEAVSEAAVSEAAVWEAAVSEAAVSEAAVEAAESEPTTASSLPPHMERTVST